MIKTAIISECGLYRYKLTRTWDESKPKVMFVMLNPSSADAYTDDPTIRRCIGFAKSWGMGGIMIGNVYAYRTNSPKVLRFAGYPVGQENKEYVNEMLTEADKVVLAWGGNIPDQDGIDNFVEELWDCEHVYHLGLTKSGEPKHPLYLSGDTELQVWERE